MQGLLLDSYQNPTDENSRNSTKELIDKIVEQRDSGYPARDYPFWRNYFGDEEETMKTMSIENAREWWNKLVHNGYERIMTP